MSIFIAKSDNMKRLITGLALIFSLHSQSQEWKTDLDQALLEAKVENKNVLLFFSVSDACDLCRRIDNIVFQSEEFKSYAGENLVLVKLDFKNSMASGNKADQLLIVEKYNKDGFFPWVVLINEQRKVIGKLPVYDDQSARQYLSYLREIDK